jgi:sensor histidine kinase YesM
MLRSLEHSAATWLAIIWQIMTLLGWVGLSPIILHLRPSSDADATETTAGEAVVQLVVATLLVVVHAAVIVLLTAMLAVPVVPTWRSMMLAAFAAYAPLDWLAYLAIITLGYVSDVERRRRVAVKREEALQAESLESRLSALRARLNPHFLFNALNSIHVLSSAGRTHETTRMVEGLTSLLRYVLDERRAKVPLSDEMAFAQEYLEVQRIRLGDRLQFEIETDPLAANTLVPQLVLQPIIENAVEHGIAQLLNGGTVRIGARIVHDRLEIDVENDGLGTDSRESTAGIGLSSTRERLARLYGASAIVSLEQRPSPPGVRARITIPVRHEAAA